MDKTKFEGLSETMTEHCPKEMSEEKAREFFYNLHLRTALLHSFMSIPAEQRERLLYEALKRKYGDA